MNMRLKLKHIYVGALIGMGGLATTSCNDFLERAPISQITPESYFTTVDQVGNYVLNYYDSQLENSNGTKMFHQTAWNSGVQRNDANTDNLLTDESTSIILLETGRYRPVRLRKVCYPVPVFGTICSNRCSPKKKPVLFRGRAICSVITSGRPTFYGH